MKRIILLLLIPIITFLICGIIQFYDPPTPKDADAFLKKNQQDIDIIVNYLKSLDTDSAFTYGAGNNLFYDFEYHITPTEVQSSISRLVRAGCEHIGIDKGDNTIWFELWDRTRGHVSCGIACTLDGQGFPKAELQTACEPISDGWFYYFSNYEEYRKNPSKYDEMWDTHG